MSLSSWIAACSLLWRDRSCSSVALLLVIILRALFWTLSSKFSFHCITSKEDKALAVQIAASIWLKHGQTWSSLRVLKAASSMWMSLLRSSESKPTQAQGEHADATQKGKGKGLTIKTQRIMWTRTSVDMLWSCCVIKVNCWLTVTSTFVCKYVFHQCLYHVIIRPLLFFLFFYIIIKWIKDTECCDWKF